MEKSPSWHPGEIAAQKRAGSYQQMQSIGPRVMQKQLSDQQQGFFAHLPLVMISAEEPSGRLWASVLFGEPGFIHSPDSGTLIVESSLNPLDPLANALAPGSDIALLGIDLRNRRRNRVNAAITSSSENRLVLSVKQAFGNCHKYIQLRQRRGKPAYEAPTSSEFTQISEALHGFITCSDTCFIASKFQDGSGQENRGIDLSHRGGHPGFILPADDSTLLIPDYAGNHFFNTVGNLMLDPHSALLFFNFSKGHLVQMSGQAEVVWASDETLPFPDVERMIRFSLQQGRVIRHAMPFVYGQADYSPYNPPVTTGS